MSKILMIDDDKDFSGLVLAHFSKLGYAVTLTDNGTDGLAQAAKVKPDVIFLDIMMPGLNGIEVLRELQSGDETSDIPVLVVSGKYLDQGGMELFAQERNFKAFISKPVALAGLQQKVEALLGR
jgi:CheY-like chemotaxis protein